MQSGPEENQTDSCDDDAAPKSQGEGSPIKPGCFASSQRQWSVWTEAHAKLIKRTASYPEVERIFVHPPIKKALCDWELTQPGSHAWLAKSARITTIPSIFTSASNAPAVLMIVAISRCPNHRMAPAAARSLLIGIQTSPGDGIPTRSRRSLTPATS
jgi:Penicillin-insensitive murein endopeptidase